MPRLLVKQLGKTGPYYTCCILQNPVSEEHFSLWIDCVSYLINALFGEQFEHLFNKEKNAFFYVYTKSILANSNVTTAT